MHPCMHQSDYEPNDAFLDEDVSIRDAIIVDHLASLDDDAVLRALFHAQTDMREKTG